MTVSKYRKTGLFGSLTIHVILFMILAFGGFFTHFNDTYAADKDEVYTVDDDNSGGSSRGGSTAAGNYAEPTSSDVVLTDHETKEVYNEITDKQKKEQLNTNFTQQNNSSTSASAEASRGKGSSGVNGTDSGYGDGSGSGSGSGNGNGSGAGSGTGDGSGDGSGSDPSKLKVAVPPRPLSTPQPEYPESMREEDEEGSVTLRFVVAASGEVESVSVAASSGEGAFEQAALAAGRCWTFSPALNGYNQSVRCSFTQTINFTLN